MAIGLALIASSVACSSDARRAAGDRTLVAVIPVEPESLDPRLPSDAYGLKVTRLIFGSLVTIDPYTLEPVPDLAERVEVRSPTEYVVHIRPGLRFSDGSPLDAEDVLATIRAIGRPDMRSVLARLSKRIRTMEKLDPLTVRFALTEPHATFLTDLELPIVRRVDERRRIGTAESTAWPVGAGPFRLVRRHPGRFSFVPNPRWHHPHAGRPLDLVVLRDDNTRAMRLLASAADLALNAIPPLLTPLFAGEPGFRVQSATGAGTTYVAIHTEHRPFDDVRVRRALAHALDREVIVRGKFSGRARVARSWLPPGHWAHASDTPSYAYDPALARRLLDSAGVRDPDGDGPEPRLRVAIRTSTDRFRQSIARALAAQLRQVGIAAEVRPSEIATLLTDLRLGRFDLAVMQVPEIFEPNDLAYFFSSDAIPEGGRLGSNRFRYRSAEADRLIEQGRTTVERARRVAVYRRLQHVMARDVPTIPLWHEDVVGVVRTAALPRYRVPRDARFGTLARP
ncbi:MAG: ABC transporter substrate-binding protein [Deltaproteobacteria bacterium]|nr:ABC transporter substrate-binding protein [Deltaproteobacteria bacterium]